MTTNEIIDTGTKALVSAASAGASWGLQDISYVASIAASLVAILVGLSTFYNIAKAWRKK
tara:strand:- start:170 stop:349 length:180 start_codon:yes stop_codon:yes gene_type:complete